MLAVDLLQLGVPARFIAKRGRISALVSKEPCVIM
jgi:hypothetical protein